MRLSRIKAWNFRSFWSEEEDAPSFDITLMPGVNYLSGPNNVGKSNILRALAFALDPRQETNQVVDQSHGATWGPAVMLEFEAGPNPSSDIRKMLEAVDAFEQTLPDFSSPSHASQNRVRFYVEADDLGSRNSRFLTGESFAYNAKAKLPKSALNAVSRFSRLVRYVDVKSGEGFESLFRRGFERSLAVAVLGEHSSAMAAAELARDAYRAALGQMLRPIARHVQDRIRKYVPDIHEVDIVAQVPSVDEAVAAASFELKDAVQTTLEGKGTGVRGAMLLLLLSFIADGTRTPVVFGIEEPEAFLHPEAHRALGDGLARFAQHEHVTLLVTTHSPFLYRADGDPRNAVFRVTKDETGRSSVEKAAPEAARADLLGSTVIANLLDRIESVPERTRLIVVVEGETDARYLELASRHLGIPITDWHLVYWKKGVSTDAERGAAGAAVQAVTIAARHAPGRVVVALFDSDEDGQSGYSLLADKFGWKKKKPTDGVFALRYSEWIEDYGVPVEAEDLFDPADLDRFFGLPDHGAFKTGSKLRQKSGRWHYDLSTPGKIALVKWLGENGTPELFTAWRPVLDHLAGLVKDASK